jgi:S1-C subfamily serine protease
VLYTNLVFSATILHEQGVDRGLVVVSVVPGSAADFAGIRGITRNSFSTISLGDTITAVDNIRVDNEADFLRAIDGKVVGDTISMTVMRYIEDPKGATASGNGANKRHAVETKMRLKLSK